MLKPGVFGRWKHPPGGLQLMNLPQPLQPRMIDNLPLGNFARGKSFVRHQRHVAVERIVTEGFAAKIGHGWLSLFVTVGTRWIEQCRVNIATVSLSLVRFLGMSPDGTRNESIAAMLALRPAKAAERLCRTDSKPFTWPLQSIRFDIQSIRASGAGFNGGRVCYSTEPRIVKWDNQLSPRGPIISYVRRFRAVVARAVHYAKSDCTGSR